MSDELKSQIKQAIVRSLKLPIDPNEIDSAAPLFGAGLGLDSIDALELVLELERSFGVVVGDEQTGGQVLRSVDAIAEFVDGAAGQRSSPDRARGRVINAFTIDVEEWFHVCGVPALAEPSAVGRARVARGRRHRRARSISSIAAASGPPASSSAGSPSGIRQLVARIRDGGHEIGSHGQRHRRVYELDPDEFTRDLRLGQRGADRGRGAADVTQFRAPGMVDQRSRAVGARTARRRGLHRRFQPRAAPRRRRSHVSRDAAHDRRPRAARSSRCRRPSSAGSASGRRSAAAGACAWRGRPRHPRDRAAQRPRRAGDLLDPSVGARSRSAADDAAGRRAFAHYFRLSGWIEPAARRSCAARHSVP